MTYDLTDKWSITGGARWFEFDRDRSTCTRYRWACRRQAIPMRTACRAEHGQRHDLQVRDPVPVHPRCDGVCALQRGLPPRRRELAARGRHRDRARSPTARITCQNYEVGIKSQWFDNRLQLNVSAFLMEWDDIQLRAHQHGLRRADNGAFWLEGNFNGGKAEQKGVEFNGQWYATDASTSSGAHSSRARNSRKTLSYPNTDRRSSSPKARRCRSRPGKSTGPRSSTHFPDFLPIAGDFWTRISYTWQSKVWDSLGAIEDFEAAETP